MEFLQELFLTACMAAVFSLIVAVSIAFSGCEEKINSMEKVKLEDKGFKVVGGKTKKRKVKFVDDVEVREVDYFDFEEERSKDFNFIENFDEVLGKSLEEEVLNDVVVRAVLDFNIEEEHSKDCNFMEKFDGILSKVLEEEILKDEVKTVKMFDEFECGGVGEEAEVTVSGAEIVEEYGNMNLVGEVKDADVEEKAYDFEGVGLLHKALEKGLEEEMAGDAKVGEFNGLEAKALVGSWLEMLTAVEEMKREEIDDASIDQEGVEVGERADIAALSGGDLERGAVEERTESTDISFDTHGGVKETDIREFNGGLEDLSVDKVDDDVSIDQKGVEVGERDANTAAHSGEALAGGAVEERIERTEIDFNTPDVVRETMIHAVDGALENLSAKENSRSQAFTGESEFERLDGNAIRENQEGGVVVVGEHNAVGIEKDQFNVSKVEESTEREDEFEKGEGGGDDDDWEGIERSELEKVFAEAVNYVEYGGRGKDDQVTNLGSDVQLQLYGLHKVAIEGPCYESQPMALKVSARAKWNAWQRLGSMNRELAMEQYIKLLSETDPDWTYHPDAGDGKDGYIESVADGCLDTNVSVLKEFQAANEEGGSGQLGAQKHPVYVGSGEQSRRLGLVSQDKEHKA